MPEQSSRVVVGKQGRLGRIDPFHEPGNDGPSTILVKFDTGEEALIPFDQLHLLPDDNYYLLSESNIEQWKIGSAVTV